VLLLRSIVFNVAFFAWTVAWTALIPLALLLPRKQASFVQVFWSRGMASLLRILVNIKTEISGLDGVPEGAAIVACKHQSIWETTVFHGLFDQPAIVLKRELMWIPIFGWYIVKMGMIPVDRNRGTKALRLMLHKAEVAKSEGRKIIIFPEGTRVSADSNSGYRSGIYLMYNRLGLPVIPVALNAGDHWGQETIYRYPGTIRLVFLEPIEPGLSRGEFMARLQASIDGASTRLSEAPHSE
jgi:1-acyl-sn-glycerol-3-phosphate acyltransferase